MSINEINEVLEFLGMDPINIAELLANLIVNGIIFLGLVAIFAIVFWQIKKH